METNAKHPLRRQRRGACGPQPVAGAVDSCTVGTDLAHSHTTDCKEVVKYFMLVNAICFLFRITLHINTHYSVVVLMRMRICMSYHVPHTCDSAVAVTCNWPKSGTSVSLWQLIQIVVSPQMLTKGSLCGSVTSAIKLLPNVYARHSFATARCKLFSMLLESSSRLPHLWSNALC